GGSRAGSVQGRTRAGYALGLLKRGALVRPVSKPGLTRAVGPPDRAVEAGEDNAVMVAVGDEQPVLCRQHLAGEAQRSRRFADLLERDRRGRRMKQTPLLELLQHAGDERIELLEGQFALVLSDDATLRVDEHQRRPGPAAEALDRKSVV